MGGAVFPPYYLPGSACNVGDLGSIPGSGRSSGEGNGNPLQYPCPEKSHERGSPVGYSPWGRKESDMTATSQAMVADKAMAPHSRILAWKLPWTEEPGRLQSVGSLRIRHDRATSFSLFTFMHWRWKWQPTPVFLPGEFQGRRSLVACHLWGRTESDTTEAT